MASLLFATAACSTSQQTANAPNRPSGQAPSNKQIMKDLDANNDGKISKSEAKGPLANDFSKVDANKDGYISKDELDKAPKPKGGRQPRQ